MVTLRHNRIYVLPTMFGALYAATAVLVLIGAINYQLSLAYLFAFVLIGLGHAALLQSYRNLLKLELHALVAEPVFAGDTAHFPVALANTGKPPRRALSVSLHGQPASWVESVPRDDATIARLPVATTGRGWLGMPTLRIDTTYPSGWCKAWSYANLDARCLVYPRPEDDPPPYHGQHGDQGQRRVHGDDDFAGLRNYVPGDMPRQIAWKQFARLDTLLVRQDERHEGHAWLFDWHALPELGTEARLSRLTAWIIAAEANGDRYALALPGSTLPRGNGPAHRHACLQALALFDRMTP
ncbi:membrane protein [Jeongeupia chitinilytica]|uniref:Membrane protein n=1 Tax=Jeongeupia chitinilytica TaxID=1041641 RepID=A0ABQ3GWH3_9NEIS|nr:membrane protein [Jeongeupia chitinilytica]